MANKNDKGGGARKYDRNRVWCQAYRNRGQRERNKVRRLLRHFRRYGVCDPCAASCYNNLPKAGKPAQMQTVTVERPSGRS